MSAESESEPRLLANRYALSNTIREGAQAIVTQAFDMQLGRLVAIKRVRFGPADERAREAFQREVGMLQDLRHPNIVEMLDVDRDDQGNWYLVLEWLPDNLETIIKRTGALTWGEYWTRWGRPLLNAIIFGQEKRIAHRDIKPRNILVTETGVPKLADYGIAKLLDQAWAWAPVKGHTFRFHYTPGYTPSEPDQPEHSFSRDCYSFAAVAISCLTGRILSNEQDQVVAIQEAALPPPIRPLLERCLSKQISERPPLASVMLAGIERAEEDLARASTPTASCFLSLSNRLLEKMSRRLGIEERNAIEQFVLDELNEASALLLADSATPGEESVVELVGVTWRFRATLSGRYKELIELFDATEVGAALATEMRDRSFRRALSLSFGRPRDAETTGQQLRLLLAEVEDFQRQVTAQRDARSKQRIFRVWRSYLRDRADLEAKRANAIKYVDRSVTGESLIFTAELAQSDELVGQERVVLHAGGRLVGEITSVAFNQIMLNITFGDATQLPRRGELAINTIAAQRALEHQSSALNAVFYERAVNPALKSIILDPRTAKAVVVVEGVTATDDNFDDEKKDILAKALGVQDFLTIEGPPGTGKTTLIAEIVVQWLRRNPRHRILLTSQTHIALDNVLERVTEMKLPIEMIRIGRADEPRISELGHKLLLERRVEAWIKEVRKAAEGDMERWAEEMGVDRHAVAVGMKVERLLQVLAQGQELRDHISKQEVERANVESASVKEPDGAAARDEVEEETTQIDSEIGAGQQALRLLSAEEGRLRAEMKAMGPYAAELSSSHDRTELAEWARHFLANEPKILACRDRLALLEDWLLRVGRSSDFNAAMLSSAQVIAGTCVGIAGVKGMEEVAYDLCIVDEASKATATEILIPLSRSKRWIVVGDPKQLPPSSKSSATRSLRNSILQRFVPLS
jgi:serine/threonine protein kinase